MDTQIYRSIFDILTIAGPLFLLNWRLEDRLEKRMSHIDLRIRAHEERMSQLDERWIRAEEQILKIMNKLDMNR